MKKFLLMLLSVLFCTSALCSYDVLASTAKSEANENTSNLSSVQTVKSIKSTALNTAFDSFSDEEVYLTAQLVHHEAHNQAYNGKVAIAEVVLNRINSSFFPNTIDKVIFQNGQFTSTRRLKNINPTEEEVRIAYNVLNGKLRVLKDSDVLYFRNPEIVANVSAKVDKDWGKLDYYTYIGDHAFYAQNTLSADSESQAVAKADSKDTVKADVKVDDKDNNMDEANAKSDDLTVATNETNEKESIFSKIPNVIASLLGAGKNNEMELADSSVVSDLDATTLAEPVAEQAAASETQISLNDEEAAVLEGQLSLYNDEALTPEMPSLVSDEHVSVVDIPLESLDAMSSQSVDSAYGLSVQETKAEETSSTGEALSIVIEETADSALAKEQKKDAETEPKESSSSIDMNQDSNQDNTQDDEDVSVHDLQLLAVNNSKVCSNEDKKEKSAVEEELDDFDEDDPVAIARRRALLEQKAEAERQLREYELQMNASKAAQAQAKSDEIRQVELIAKANEETAKATKNAVDKVIALQNK